jgi:hypothetical protein
MQFYFREFCGKEFFNSVGPGRWSGKAERNLSWPPHFCILRWSDRQWK